MSTKIYESVFEFKDNSNNTISKMSGSVDNGLTLHDSSGRSVYVNGAIEMATQVGIGGGLVNINFNIGNKITTFKSIICPICEIWKIYTEFHQDFIFCI